MANINEDGIRLQILRKEQEKMRLYEVTPRAESVFRLVIARINREIKQLENELNELSV